MTQAEQNTVTVPGISIIVGQPPDFTKAATFPTQSAILNFDAVKHLLSNRPLRHPNRRRPIKE
jgi:hypothetical protein